MTTATKIATRRSAYSVLGALGANRLLRKLNADVVRIFTLHGVSDATPTDAWTPMRPQLGVERFDKLLAALAKHYKFISMDTAVDLLTGKCEPIKQAIAFTFDDGYSNNFREALPVLEKYNAPATFYVTTESIKSRQPFWFDRLDYALQCAAGKNLRVEFAGKEFAFDTPCPQAVSHSFAALRDHAKKAFKDDQSFTQSLGELAGRIEQETGKALQDIIEGDHWSRVATATELAKISEHPLVTIGSHTVSHLRLSFADDEAMAHELRESKATIEEWTGKPVDHFAYPNGAFDDRSMLAVRNAGYRSAVTSDSGVNTLGHDLMRISRLSIPSSYTPAEIKARASGLESAVLRRLKRFSRGKT